MTYKALKQAGTDDSIIECIKETDLLDESLLDDSMILELIKNKEVFKDVINRLLNDKFIYVYSSVDELGNDNSDNGCREEDDTDYMFGSFLISAYKTGNSNGTVYYLFNNGKVLVI